MADIILHHFDASPFAEKVRVALGIKGLAWHSVEIPMVMPKPDLVALTGGYRKTPVMQIGADVYCDTARIAVELQRRFGGAALFDESSEAQCQVIAAWSDAARQLAEYRLEAWQLLEGLQAALAVDGEALLTADERDALQRQMSELRQAMESDDGATLHRASEALGQASESFAARRMDKSIREALAGVALEELDDEVGE